jgi:hypothetical protein
MLHNLIKTREYLQSTLKELGEELTGYAYLLVLSDAPIKKGDTFFDYDTNYIGRTVEKTGIVWACEGLDNQWHLLGLSKKIIAHLPLNGAPILEGVDLLPPLPTEMVDEINQPQPPTAFEQKGDTWEGKYI